MERFKQVFKELREKGIETDYKPIRFQYSDAEKDFKKLFNHFVPNYKHLSQYNEVIEWLKDNKGKGISLFGSTGQGKSIIIKSILPTMFYYKFNKLLRPINAYQIVEKYKFAKKGNDIKPFKVERISIIDEIGNEPDFIDYGAKIDLISQIIDQSEEKKALLIIASNVTAERFIERYGMPIYDRIINITKVVNFKNKTLRK